MALADKPIRHRKIGSYRVLGALGRGGMGQVYRGIHEHLQREVALKELLPWAMKDPESQSRFRREALALAGFRHQNIVTLYDLVEKNDALFMVMEYVDGPTLADLLKEGPTPPEVAAVLGARMASALDHAHFRRIIHRDLKPGNVMLTKSGEVKLMDFGIAKDVELSSLTQEGMAVGTPSYMSPEQITGAPLDPRTDLFSLGVVLYECLTGVKPFKGATAGEVFARIREGRYAPLSRVAPSVPKALAQIVKKALATKRDHRYPDAAAMRRDLDVFLARAVHVSHAALLIAFLKQRDRVTPTEALVHLTEGELHAARRAQGRSGARWAWVVALALAAGGGASLYLSDPAWVRALRWAWP